MVYVPRARANSQVAPPGGGSVVVVPVTFQQLHSGRVLHLGSKHMCSWLFMWELLFPICLTAVLTHALRSKRSQIHFSMSTVQPHRHGVYMTLHRRPRASYLALTRWRIHVQTRHTQSEVLRFESPARQTESSSSWRSFLHHEVSACRCSPVSYWTRSESWAVSVLMSHSTAGTRCEHVLRPERPESWSRPWS